MIAGTHVAFASALYLGGAALFEYETDPVGWAIACAASLLPDADLPTSKLGRALSWLSTRLGKRFGHRTITHSVIAIAAVFWELANVAVTRGTSPESRTTMMHDDPHGFSGSLVWNTHFMELSNAGKEWTPDAAVVTGLLRRFDPSPRTLLVLRVEHLNAWVNIHMPL